MNSYRPRHLRVPTPVQSPVHDIPAGQSRRGMFRAGLVGAGAVLAGPTVGLLGQGQASAAVPSRESSIHGQDVSAYQGTDIDWSAQKSAGSHFVWVKATEGRTYTSPTFSAQYTGASKAGLIRGGYHFARPDTSDATEQADAFLNGGGGWTTDGRTLPGLLDMEATSGKPRNYGLSKKQMRTWIAAFIKRYQAETGRKPIVYTNRHWWTECVGDWTPTNAPLHIASYGSKDPKGSLPGRWWGWEMWQYSSSGPFAGDSNVWYGSKSAFEKFVSSKDYDANGI